MKTTIVRRFFLPLCAVTSSFAILVCSSCQFGSGASAAVVDTKPKVAAPVTPAPAGEPVTITTKKADAPATIIARQQVPILCYHQVRDWRPTDSKVAKDYIVPVANFKEQMKMLADSGYHTISPDQLYNYLSTGAALPTKPILLTFDDTDLEQFTIAKPEMEKYGFRGTYFIMTVSLDRPRYMSKAQVKELAAAGHTIGSHTWDHKNVKKYTAADWTIEIDKPTRQLEAITGKPVKYFAFPFGLWNKEAIPQLKERGFVAAFQLSTPRDAQEPLYTIRRIIVPGAWTTTTLRNWINGSFK